MEEWISFERALELILEHTGAGVGRSENIRRQALASGDVRFRNSGPVTEETSRPVQREAGLVIVIGGRTERDELNYGDLLDWLDRIHPKPSKSAPAPKAPPARLEPDAAGGSIRQRPMRAGITAAFDALYSKGVPPTVQPAERNAVVMEYLRAHGYKAPNSETALAKAIQREMRRRKMSSDQK
jgi:hypothetical protein